MKCVYLCLLLITTVVSLPAKILFSADFETVAPGTAVTRPVWESMGFLTDNWDNGLAVRTAVDTIGEKSSRSIRLFYPGGAFGSTATGTQVKLLLNPAMTYTAQYDMQFDSAFSWGGSNEGGKLPCLAGGERCGSDFICDGTDGFSARIMWRPNGRIVLYLYYVDMNKTYGEDFPLIYPNGDTVYFAPGTWYTIREEVKMNSDSASYDGHVKIWIDGKEVITKDSIRLRTNDDQIDHFFFSSFHGGHDSTWAPAQDSWARFDNLKIAETPEDLDPVVPIAQSSSLPIALPIEIAGSTVRFTGKEPATVSVCDLRGKEILRKVVSDGQFVSVEQLARGTYVVNVRTNGIAKSLKMNR